MRQATWEAISPCPALLLAAGTLARFGERGPTGAGGRATCVVLAAREDVSSRWVEKGRREGDRRRNRKEQKPPATSTTEMFLSD